MLHFIIGGAGTGKSTLLLKKIKQLLPREPDCLILVPEQFSYEFDKKLYHFIGAKAFNQLETHSFTSISRMLFQKYGKYTAQYADATTKKALLLQAVQMVREKQVLHFFDRQCLKPDFMESVEQILSVLRRNGTSAAILYETALHCNGRLHDKLQDLSYIYQQYETLLQTNGLEDALTDITEAAAISNLHDFFLGKTIFIDEFESFTEDEYAMLQVMIATAADVYMTLRIEETVQSDDTLFATLQDTRNRMQQLAKQYHIACDVQVCRETKRFASDDLAHLSQTIFRSSGTQKSTEPTSHIHLFEARDAVSEMEYVCATIRQLLIKNADLHCRDIVILTNDLSAYAPIVNHAFARYDLPFYLDAAVSILHHPFSVYLLTMLELVQQKSFRTEYLLRYAKTGFAGCDWIALSQLENYCYQWNVKGKTWEFPFPLSEKESMRQETMQVEKTREQLITPLLTLRQTFTMCKTGADYCRALYQHIQQTGVLTQLSAFCETEEVNKTISMQQDAKYIWEQFISILDCLYQLYETIPLSLSDFCFSLSYLFRAVTYATPPRTLDAVFIGQTGRSRLSDPKIVFVIHCSEGVFPSTGLSADLFSEREYRLMEEKKIVIRKALQKILADERLAVYKTLSAASQELYLTYPLVDAGNQKSYPSFVIAQIQEMFPNGSTLLQTEQQIPLRYYATTLQSAYYHYVRNFSTKTTEISTVQYILQQYTVYQQKIAYLQNVHQNLSFKITDPQIMERLMGKQITMTASKLEHYLICPFQFFCESAMHLYQRQKIRLDPASQGTLIHFCLEQILRKYKREAFLALTETELMQLLEELTNQFWREMLGGDFSKEPRSYATYTYIQKQLLITLLHVQAELRQTIFYPEYLELLIHHNNTAFPPLKAHTEDGHSLQIEGIVDRVDTCQISGRTCVRVIDYKSGTKEFSLGNLLYGLDMQMLIYLFSIVYNQTPLQNAQIGGILYMPAGGVKEKQERGEKKSKAEQEQSAYRMNGLLVQNPEIIHNMEPDGKGIYIPAKLKTGQSGAWELDTKAGTYLSESAFRALYRYVMETLKQTTQRIYQGDIAANPLILPKKNTCQYCTYQDICGNLQQQFCRVMEGQVKERKEQMMKKLQELEKEEREHGMDNGTAASNFSSK